jgi:hypothetical protein
MDLGIALLGAMIVLILGLPLIVAAGSAYYWRRRLSRPWWYCLTATVALYWVYAMAMTWYPPIVSIAISQADTAHPASHELLWWWPALAPLGPGLTAFIIGAVPTVALLARLFRRVEQP